MGAATHKHVRASGTKAREHCVAEPNLFVNAPSAARILSLQRTIGNQSVERAIQSGVLSPHLFHDPHLGDAKAGGIVQRVNRVKTASARSAQEVNRLSVEELKQIVENEAALLKDDLDDIKLLPDIFMGHSRQDVIDQAKETLKEKLRESRAFNVRGRAIDPHQDALMITDNPAAAAVASQLGVPVCPTANAMLALMRISKSGLQLIRKSATYEYYSRQQARGKRDDASEKIPTGAPTPIRSPGGMFERWTILTRPCRQGDTSQTKEKSMGGWNARQYQIHCGWNPLSGGAQWEWLHLIGSAIGGGNEYGNLVAGTYDGNTRMIPFEHQIVEWSKRIDPSDPRTFVKYTVRAKLIGPTWAAHEVQVEAVNQQGASMTSPWLPTQSGVTMDKVEYDLELAELKAAMGF